MSDFFDEMLNGIPNVNQKVLAKNKMILNNVLKQGDTFDDSSSSLSILVDYNINNVKLLNMANQIEKYTGNYQIIYPLSIEPTDKFKGSLKDLYINYSIDLSTYIKPWSNVICLGRTLFTICKATDLDASVMSTDDGEEGGDIERNSICSFAYDTLLWKTWFFDPLTKSRIYPADSTLDLFSKKSNNKWASNFETWFFDKQVHLALTNNFKPMKLKKLIKTRVENVNEWLSEHKDDKAMIALDTETNTLDPFSNIAKLKCITIAYNSNSGYYLPFDDSVDINLLSEYLKDRPIIGTNLKYDIKFFLNLGISIDNFKIVGDTIILQGLCNELCRRGLKAGAFMWTTWGGYDKALDDWKEKNKCDDYSKIDDTILMDYAVTDAITSFAVHEAQLKYMNQLDEKYNKENKYGYSLKYCYNEIMIPMYNIVCETEQIGMSIDKEKLDKVSTKMIQAIKDSEYNIKKQLGKENDPTFNINGEDLGIALEEMGLPITDRKENGKPSVGVAQLHTWSNKGYKIADDISHYRELSKNFTCFIGVEKQEELNLSTFDDDIFDGGTYVKTKKKAKKRGPSGLYKYSHDDGKVHGSFSMYSCQSLRNRSSNMNLQQVPAHGQKATIARSCFTPLTKHHAFFSLDFSSIQARLATIFSQDKNLIWVYNEGGGDMHLRTSEIFVPHILKDLKNFDDMNRAYSNKNYEHWAELKDLRQMAKGPNFLLIFNGSPNCLTSLILDWKPTVIEEIIKAKHLEKEWMTTYQKALNGEIKSIPNNLSNDDKKLYAKAMAIAKDIHKGYFELYHGLREWEDNQMEFAKQNGYSQSYFGTLRRTPYLLYQNSSSQDVDGKKYANNCNLSLNTLAQVCEVMTISRSFIKAHDRMKKQGLWLHKDSNGEWCGTYLQGLIHDAIEGVVDLRNEEYKKTIPILYEEFNRDYPEYYPIKMESEGNIASYYHTGEYWDMGTVVDEKCTYTVPNCDKVTGLPIEEKGKEEVSID